MTSMLESLTGSFPRVTLDEWKASVEKALKGEPFDRKLIVPLPDGTRVKPLYTEADAPSDPGARPGWAPFTRGFPAPGKAGGLRRGWMAASRVEHPSLRHANTLALEDLAGGVGAIELVVRDATGAAASNAARADVASVRGGLWVDSPAALLTALGGVHWSMAPVAVRAPGSPNFAVEMVAMAVEGSPEGRTGLFAQCDPFEDLVDPDGAEGPGSAPRGVAGTPTTFVGLVENVLSARKASTDSARWNVGKEMSPGEGRCWLVSSEAPHRAGGHAVQEIAYVTAGLVDLLRTLCARGIGTADALRGIELRLAIGNDFFTEIAKVRALRKVVGRVLEVLGARDVAGSVFLSAVTSELTLSKLDPWVNLLRSTEQAAAAVFAGVDKLLVLPFDLRSAGESRFGHRMARNAQAILAEESGLAAVADPAGGSWYVEARTEELAARAWESFTRWEAAGGLGKALEAGVVQAEIEAAWEDRRRALARRKEPVLGASEFPLLDETRPARDEGFDPAAFLAGFATAKVGTGRTSAAAAPAPVVALKPFPRRYLSEPFEALRETAEATAKTKGARPAVFLALDGEPGLYAPRLSWVRNLLAVGGFAVVQGDPCKPFPETVEAFRKSGASAALLVSSDERYDAFVPEACAALRGAGATEVWLAGAPRDKETAWRAAGVSRFAFVGCDVPELLEALFPTDSNAKGGAQ